MNSVMAHKHTNLRYYIAEEIEAKFDKYEIKYEIDIANAIGIEIEVLKGLLHDSIKLDRIDFMKICYYFEPNIYIFKRWYRMYFNNSRTVKNTYYSLEDMLKEYLTDMIRKNNVGIIL